MLTGQDVLEDYILSPRPVRRTKRRMQTSRIALLSSTRKAVRSCKVCTLMN